MSGVFKAGEFGDTQMTTIELKIEKQDIVQDPTYYELKIQQVQ